MQAYIASKYPNVKILTTGYGESNTATSLTVAEGIIKACPTVNAPSRSTVRLWSAPPKR